MTGSTIGLPTPPLDLRRGDIIWGVVAGERRSFRVRSPAKDRPHGFKISTMRMDTERESQGYLYFAAGECVYKATSTDVLTVQLPPFNAPLIAHAEAPEQRLLVDTVGDVAWRVGEHGFWLRVAGRWAPMAERWSWERRVVPGGRWHAKG